MAVKLLEIESVESGQCQVPRAEAGDISPFNNPELQKLAGFR